MEMKRCFLLPSFMASRTVRCNTFINRKLWTLYIALTLKKPLTSYSRVNLEKLINLYSYANLQKKYNYSNSPFMTSQNNFLYDF